MNKQANELAEKYRYQVAKYLGEWNGYNVYVAGFNDGHMLFTYPAIIHNDKDGMWLEFIDFNCHTYADTLNELLYNAKEAMECHILGLLECGVELPVASTVDNPNSIFIQCYIDLA